VTTLYLTDLDGTLLQPDGTLSAYAERALARMTEEGLIFSFATARSLNTAGKIMEGVPLKFPLIVHNGAFIVEQDNKILHMDGFTREESTDIFAEFASSGLTPLVYAQINGRSRFSFLRKNCSRAQLEFVETRIGNDYDRGRAREIDSADRALDGDVFYFACIDEKEKLGKVHAALEARYRCFYSQDVYTGEYWLEILSKTASKAAAAQKLKTLLGCDRLVCFGDGINDVPMFTVADECYAVANAAPALKELATAVIGSNAEDGVVKWLEARAEFRKNS
jgi:hypothetical protein